MVLGDLTTELYSCAADFNVGDGKRRTRRRGKDGPKPLPRRSAKQLKPASRRRAIGQAEAGVVEMVDIQSHGVCQRDHSTLARKSVHTRADGRIAVAALVAETRTLGEGNGGSDLHSRGVLSPHRRFVAEYDFSKQNVSLLGQVHSSLAR